LQKITFFLLLFCSKRLVSHKDVASKQIQSSSTPNGNGGRPN
jgi:hypothetical protein